MQSSHRIGIVGVSNDNNEKGPAINTSASSLSSSATTSSSADGDPCDSCCISGLFMNSDVCLYYIYLRVTSSSSSSSSPQFHHHLEQNIADNDVENSEKENHTFAVRCVEQASRVGGMKVLETFRYQSAAEDGDVINVSEFCIEVTSDESSIDEVASGLVSNLREYGSFNSSRYNDSGGCNLLVVTDVFSHKCRIPLYTKANRDVTFKSNQILDTSQAFVQHGLAVISDVFDNCKEDFNLISSRVNQYIEQLLSKVDALEPGSPVRFKEIMRRGEGRFDAALGEDVFAGTCLSSDRITNNEWFTSICNILDRKRHNFDHPLEVLCAVSAESKTSDSALPPIPPPTSSSSYLSSSAAAASASCLQPTIIKRGVVFSRPGAVRQYLHADAAPEIPPRTSLCLFIPLIDLTESTGYTSFWLGSQVSHQSDLFQHNVVDLMERSCPVPRLFKGLLQRGQALMYDYKTVHRGEANNSSAIRPVLYIIFALEGFTESYNFTTKSIDDKS